VYLGLSLVRSHWVE